MKKIFTFTIALITAALLAAPMLSAQSWLEVPQVQDTPWQHVVRTATMSDPTTGKETRNFTYAYAPAAGVSLWVAYPLNRGLIGEGSRTDAWDFDPDLPQNIQRVLYKSFGEDEHGHYDRGHQIPSADRLSTKANRRTFAFTNIAPQDPTLNGGLWNDLEQRVRSWAKRSDTLYVVTGVLLEGTRTVSDNDGNAVTVPSHFWKAVLRKNTDKYGRVHWSMCAVVLANVPRRSHGFKEAGPVLRNESIPVKSLERYTGLEFFPELKKIIGEEEYLKLKTAHPLNENWWWN